jgi:hypothetical protein
MTVRLHGAGFEHAKKLVAKGASVLDERGDWSEHQPGPAQENAFIDAHGMVAFGRWHLGIDDATAETVKEHWKYPYGDLQAVHRCGVLAVESRAGQRKHTDIELAAAHLHGMLEAQLKTGV